MAPRKVTATTAATSTPVMVTRALARVSRAMRRRSSCRSPAAVASPCTTRARSITRVSRELITPSRPEMAVSRNTGATDSWIALASPSTGEPASGRAARGRVSIDPRVRQAPANRAGAAASTPRLPT